MSEESYRAWIRRRRAAGPPDEMPDRVMLAVKATRSRETRTLGTRLACWIERSRPARYVACVAAMLIGSVPFLFYLAVLMVI